MILRLLRKMLGNRWMVSCLLIGFLLASALLSTIPIYSRGAMQRMLIRDLENYQVSSGYYPGGYYTEGALYGLEREDSIKRFQVLDKSIRGMMSSGLQLPVVSTAMTVINDYIIIVPEVPDEDGNEKISGTIEAMEGFNDHINIIQGRLPSSGKADGLFEVMVTEEALKKMDLLLDKVYVVSSIVNEGAEPLRIKVVGVFTIKDNKDLYWRSGYFSYSDSFFMNYDTFLNDYMKEETSSISYAEWYYAYDYHKINVDNLADMISTIESQGSIFRNNGLQYKVQMADTLVKYKERAEQLKLMLWVIQIPVMVMLIFYLFMVSRLTIDQEENEIAVLKSRGASRLQIVNVYFMEGIVLSAIALILGPPLGLLICKVLGASNGFMEFVQRTSLPVVLGWRPYLYSVYAIIAIIITMLMPVVPASRTTIVAYKQKKVRYKKKQIWEKYFLDILLLAVSCYGLYNYSTRQSILKITGADASEIPIDPLLFVISTLFILSVGLVFLRIFPYIVRFIFYIGRRRWTPTLYASLINVSRSKGMEQFLMLFLILTISIGVFNANAARTINSNVEEKERYSVGADITLKAKWPTNEVAAVPEDDSSSPSSTGPVIYMEPLFSDYENLSGVESATKVLKRNDVRYNTGDKGGGNVLLMGIIPSEFGEIAWFRNDLLPYHWYNYLNLLSKSPRGMLVSRSIAEKSNVKVGDSIYVQWGEDNMLDGIVMQIVDYWPSYNPYEIAYGKNTRDLIVANLSFIQAKTPIEPYEVWIKKAPGATSQQIYNDIKEKKLEVITLKDASQQVITEKSDPLLQGTNGALTLGFIVTMIISTVGFLIYWILSIKSRTLQFGILRAMGTSMGEIIRMLFYDQILVSGTSILAGIIIGGVTSDLFVPLLQIMHSSAEQVPPFKVTAYGGDYIKLYVTIGLMLIIGIAVLGAMISRIKIDQAIKLGED